MALLSPGVQVTVNDQSNYIPAATNSVPFILLATASNKISGAGVGVAAGTLSANANKTYLMTSQRDLLNTFGVPFFYNTTAGTPINGYELNEYGLLAAYSALGVTNQCYVQRVDIDLAALTASLARPVGTPPAGTYWLDTNNSNWGIFEWNLTTGAFTNKIPTVITNSSELEAGSTVPLQSVGSIGNYAVTATNIYNPEYYKRGGPTAGQTSSSSLSDLYNTWVLIGSDEWCTAWPTIEGTLAPTAVSGNILINNTASITVGANSTPTSVSNSINNAAIPGVYSAVQGGALYLYADNNSEGFTVSGATGSANVSTGIATLTFANSGTAAIATPYPVGAGITISGANVSGYNGTFTVTASTNTSVSFATTATGTTSGARIAWPGSVTIGQIAGTSLAGLGITQGVYAVPAYQSSPSFQNPRWNNTATIPQPTGSVWQKTNNVNAGTNLVVSQYSSTLGTFVPQSCPIFASDATALYGLDPSGGGTNIAQGATYAQVDPYNNATGGFQLFNRYAPGATVVTGATTSPGPFVALNTFTVGATQAGTSAIKSATATIYPSNNLAITYLSGDGAVATLSFVAQSAPPFEVGSTIVVSGITPSAPGYNGTWVVTDCSDTTVQYSCGASAATNPTPGGIVYGAGTAADFISAVSSAGIPYVSATVNNAGAIVFTHSQGGDIYLTDTAGTPVTTAGFGTGENIVGLTAQNVNGSTLILSNWVTTPTFTYTASTSGPDQNPISGTYWYYSATNEVDIMVLNDGQWMGYQTVNNDARGYDLSATNASGPQISPTAPTTQNNSAKSPLVQGDLWIDTSNLELYPVINRWETVNGINQWVTLSNTNQTTENGILFADARWATNGTTNPVSDAIPSITSLLTSNYLDPDAPGPDLYPNGILLWNSRRSGFNVKQFELNYFNTASYPAYEWSTYTTYAMGDRVLYQGIVYVCEIANIGQTPSTSSTYWSEITVTNTWKTASGNRTDGSPNMGRQAQRAIIVKALRAGINSNTTIREEQNQFNLIACPQYPELVNNLAQLNVDRGQTAFVIEDTPLRLSPNDIVTWATNNNGAGLPSGDGNLDIGDPYAAAFYPSCRTTDLNGNLVVQPPSHMMIRTIIRSDEVAYPWLAPAGTRRGVVDNATQIGYIEANTGGFLSLGVNQGLRDVLYQHDVNPITFIPGVGITNFGNHTLENSSTAMNRINVARLVAFLRNRLNQIGKQYLFEPNDQITRQQITNAITSLMVDLVAKRGIYDYLIVCDLTNNTPARIDANELWVDIAIEPVKAVEFIYIPLRIQNTGTIAAQTTA
jgi:hypothetical protein